jgi:hypothetical protein
VPAFQALGRLLTRHLDGILNYCHEKVPFGTVEVINGNIRAMLRRGRGYRDHEYLLLKVQPGHRHPPSPAGRMTRGFVTDSGAERHNVTERGETRHLECNPQWPRGRTRVR